MTTRRARIIENIVVDQADIPTMRKMASAVRYSTNISVAERVQGEEHVVGAVRVSCPDRRVIAVVATLTYLSIQVRQGTELLRSESRQAQVTNDQNGVYKFVEHPELGRLFSQEETPTFGEKTKLNFWIIGQMRAREHEWLQYTSGALDEETWLTYRDVIYFLLGTERARAMWELCSPYFNAGFVAMVREMISDLPYSDYWERLDALR